VGAEADIAQAPGALIGRAVPFTHAGAQRLHRKLALPHNRRRRRRRRRRRAHIVSAS